MSDETTIATSPLTDEVLPKEGPSAEDMAAHDYKTLIPKFWEKVEPLSRRQQLRIFRALMEYPLETNFPHLVHKDEKEAFFMGLQINDCKFVLQKAVFELASSKEKLEAFNIELVKAQQKEKETKDGLSGRLSSPVNGQV